MDFPTTSDVGTWKPLVLAVLHNIAADGMVRTPDVDAAIATTEGFPGWDHWGHITARGKEYPKARRDMSFALSKLRDEGKVFSPKRGSYTLKVPAQVPAQVVATKNTTKAVKAVKATRLALSNHPIMEADENLRLRVIEQTTCFGAQNPRSRTCRACPLAGFCGEAKMVLYAEAAARVAAREATLILPTPDIDAPEAEIIVTPVAVGDTPLHTAAFPLFCRECRGVIEPGVNFVRVEAEGAYHVGCHTVGG